jgi:hypothetical protein
MRTDKDKIILMHTRGTPLAEYEADPDLRNRLPLIQGGITSLSYAFLHSLSDKQFEIVCGLPYDFRVDKATQKYILERAQRQGIEFNINLEKKKISTRNGS